MVQFALSDFYSIIFILFYKMSNISATYDNVYNGWRSQQALLSFSKKIPIHTYTIYNLADGCKYLLNILTWDLLFFTNLAYIIKGLHMILNIVFS